MHAVGIDDQISPLNSRLISALRYTLCESCTKICDIMANEKSKQKSKSAKPGAKPGGAGKPWHDSLYIVAGLFVLFMIIFIAMRGQGQPLTNSSQGQDQNSSLRAPRNMTGLEEFKLTLQKTETLAIIENVTDIPENKTYLVINCGTSLVGSAAYLEKNTKLFQIFGENCTLNVPPQTIYYNCSEEAPINTIKLNNSESVLGNNTCAAMSRSTTQQMSTQECIAQYADSVYFYIQYGPSFSTFTNTTATIYIDETSNGECTFGIPEDTTQTTTSTSTINTTTNTS